MNPLTFGSCHQVTQRGLVGWMTGGTEDQEEWNSLDCMATKRFKSLDSSEGPDKPERRDAVQTLSLFSSTSHWVEERGKEPSSC